MDVRFDESLPAISSLLRTEVSGRPELLGGFGDTLAGFVREYLFVSMFRACAESLASESASRFAAMQRAEKRIEELLEELTRSFHRVRQSAIDEASFELVAGYEA